MTRKERRARMNSRAREAHRLVTVFTGYIHPETGNTIRTAIDICDQRQAEKYATAPNAKVVRSHKDGRILEVHIKSWGDDRKLKSRGEGQKTTYEEHIAERPVAILKIWTGERFRRWSSKDAFNPTRFDPDRIHKDLAELARLERSGADDGTSRGHS